MKTQDKIKEMISYCEENRCCDKCPQSELCDKTEYGNTTPRMDISEVMEALNDKD